MIAIDNKFLSEKSQKGKESSRLRSMHNFHTFPEDPVQRMVNAIEPFSYVQPHKHENPDKREVFIILTGTLLVVEFNSEGKIISHIVLNTKTGNYGAEIAPCVWHTIVSLESGTTAYELKDGPYVPITDKNFAPWAPKEGSENAWQYTEKLLKQLSLKIIS